MIDQREILIGKLVRAGEDELDALLAEVRDKRQRAAERAADAEKRAQEIARREVAKLEAGRRVSGLRVDDDHEPFGHPQPQPGPRAA